MVFSVKMLQNNFLASERFYECLDCREAIYNPLCPSCLTIQIQAWLSSYPDKEVNDKILKKLKKYVEKTNNLAGDSTTCISCRKPQAALCPYCFTNYVFNLLKKMKVNRIILKEFLQFFNYDFDHTGYSKDAEELGVI